MTTSTAIWPAMWARRACSARARGPGRSCSNYYDKASDWGLETCDKPLNEDGECPGQTIKLTFPDALERMLKENGYKIEK